MENLKNKLDFINFPVDKNFANDKKGYLTKNENDQNFPVFDPLNRSTEKLKQNSSVVCVKIFEFS
jgi:hypothetical protein